MILGSKRFIPLATILIVWGAFQPAYADILPGYEDCRAETLRMWVQTHSLITNGTRVVKSNPATGSLIPGDATGWFEFQIDIKNEKVLQRFFPGETKPDESKQPTMEILLDGSEETAVDRIAKSVVNAEAKPIGMDGSSIVYAGRVHRGFKLAALIEEASAAGTMKAVENGWSVVIGAPYFTPPMHKQWVELTLNRDFHVVRLHDNQQVFTFDWKQKEPEGFWYVHHTVLDMHPGGNTLVRIQQWVREIEVNPTISDSDFSISYSADYSVHNLSRNSRLQRR